ncbi:ABC-type multidrug transport system, ATPase and permease component [[Clostridium] polysaccharolyticum]|uniref:ABC-type multidrug transport system, ATPase and permease component n=2 Tax=[Clostridium] polysaccharolyticum TaxID=29364 RepID=A0A1I0DIV5_9FIRM|nr:ABC-type multidrug transport system, ATPase and permease component [[Clostridium] polysaccharolyticum]
MLEVNRIRLFSLIFLLIASTIVESCQPLLFGRLIDSLHHRNKLIILILIIAGIDIMGNFLNYITQRVQFVLSIHIEANAKKRIFRKILNMPYEKFVHVEKGKLVNTLQKDAEVFFRILTLIVSLGVDIASALATAVIMIGINWKLTLLFLGTFPINIFLFKKFGLKIKEKTKESKSVTDKYLTFVNEVLVNMKTIKLFGANQFAEEYFEDKVTKTYRCLDQRNEYNRKGSLLIQMINSFIGILIIVLGILQIFYGKLTVGGLVSFRTYSSSLSKYLLRLSMVNADVQEIKVSLDRVQAIIEKTENEPEMPENQNYETCFSKEVQLEDISFGYEPDVLVLNHVNASFGQNQMVSIVGQNGSGKSTILNLLSSLYRSYQGNIYLGDVELRNIPPMALYKNVCYIFQQTSLFTLTLRENLLIGNENATDEDIKEACKKVSLWEFIKTLPDGLDTVIGDKGILLSEGQKQKMVIARGMLADAKIYLLDEITANLDAESELQICNVIRQLKEHKLIINVSHRPKLLEISDYIYELNDGSLIKQER